jgi:hypothetical protein
VLATLALQAPEAVTVPAAPLLVAVAAVAAAVLERLLDPHALTRSAARIATAAADARCPRADLRIRGLIVKA